MYNAFFNFNIKGFVLSHQASQIAFTLSTLLAMSCGHPSASGWQDNNVPSSSEKSGWQDENSGWKSGNSGWQSESSGWKSGNSGWDDGSSHNFYDSSVSNDYVSRYIFVVIHFQSLNINLFLSELFIGIVYYSYRNFVTNLSILWLYKTLLVYELYVKSQLLFKLKTSTDIWRLVAKIHEHSLCTNNHNVSHLNWINRFF